MSNTKIKNAIVTGAAKRVGREIAISLAKQGWNIAIHHNSSDASDTIKECESFGVKAVAIKTDLNNFAETRKLISKANEALGEITLLVNSASIFEKCKFAETEEDIFDRHMNINFKAPFFLSQDFAKQCTGNGHIVNICDTRIVNNKSTYSAYLFTKKSLHELTKVSAIELGPEIRANSICIGITNLSDDLDQPYLDKRMEQLPLKHKTTTEEICNAILYLTDSDFLTGQAIFLDGGEQLI